MPYKKGIETKNYILNGSKKLFLEIGYNESTFKMIGKSLNINSNLITYYFSNKMELGKYTLIDYFRESCTFIDSFMREDDSPMLKYTIRNRLHYKILANDQRLFRFYSQTVAIGLLDNIFMQIPYVKQMYSEFYNFYKLKMEYPERYYIHLELGSEREILTCFTPEMAVDEKFIAFISSIFPRMIKLPESLITDALAQSKARCEDVDVTAFHFV